MIPAMAVDRPTPFERLSFLPSLSFSLSLSLSLFLKNFFVNTTTKITNDGWCGGGVISIHFFFWFFSKDTKLFATKTKKKERKKREAFIFITRAFDRELFFHTETVMPLEALPPFAIIVGAITAIGGIQYAAHVLPMGKPKAVGLDNFDRLLEKRDQRIREKSGLQK